MRENIIPPLPKKVGFKKLVEMVATTTPEQIAEYKKQQKEKNSSKDKR